MQSTAMNLGVKGKKVVFGDDDSSAPVGQDASPPRPRGMMIHPSRMQMQTNPGQQQSFQQPSFAPNGQSDRPAYVPREGGNYAPPRPLKGKLPPSERAPKTAAQARYAKKKQNKLKKKKQAAVRSAPKQKVAPAAPMSTTKPAADGAMDVDGDDSSSASDDDSGSDSDSDEEEAEAKEVAVVEKKRKRSSADDKPAEAPAPKAPTPAPASDDEEENDNDEDGDKEMDEPSTSTHGTPPPRDLILPASFTSNPLPPFPVLPPSHPAPSASLLHPLTVPHALTTATIISSSHTTPLPRSTPKPSPSTDDEPVASSSSSSASSSPAPETPVASSSTVGLSERMLSRLNDLGVSDLFAVQTGVIPFLLPPASSSSSTTTTAGLHPIKPTRDVCVSAPTGSGKTLAYVVPVVEVLSKRIVTRLRALIILPTRDLVAQVKETFESVAKGTGLKIATVTGSQSFAAEQANLVQEGKGEGSSLVDVVICTPGRLIDHLNGTPGFSLQFLRFLIIDEADRLLTQSFQDWLQVVLAKTRIPSTITPSSTSSSLLLAPTPNSLSSLTTSPLTPATYEGSLPPVPQCQKLLFSATLTRDPSKIAALKLHDPQYFVIQDEDDAGPTEHVEAGEAFAVPATLKEHYLVVPTNLKPLHLLHLLHSPDFSLRTNVLCFTKSVESAARLVELVRFFEDAYIAPAGQDAKKIVVKAYSSDLGGGSSGGERAKVLKEFKEGKVDVLICSDLIARGIDIASVSHVVSYDVPVDMRKYIHRVGRTARAGREGSAWSLVESQEARHFKGMMRGASHLEKVRKVKVEEEELEGLKPAYKVGLERLRDVFGH